MRRLRGAWHSAKVLMLTWTAQRDSTKEGVRRRCAKVVLLWLACIAACLGPSTVGAAEPAEQFLKALREQGYFELGLEYLQRLEDQTDADPHFRTTIGYRQGELLVQIALRQRTLDDKVAMLDRAQAKFEQFRHQQPQHPWELEARGRLGDILIERARLLVARAEQTALPEQEQTELRNEARRLFGEAAMVFGQYQEALGARLKELPPRLSAEQDAARIEDRDRWRGEYLQAQFVAAMLLYEQALTYPPQASQRADGLQDAERAFGRVAEKYRRRLAGLNAILLQGRCRQQLRDARGALAYFEDLLKLLPNENAALRPLKTKTLRGAMESWLEPEIGQVEAARQNAEAWLATQRATERSDDDWLAVKLLLARTYQALAIAADDTRQASQWRQEARKMAIEVAKYRSPSQEAAQQLLTALGQGDSSSRAVDALEIRTFSDAMAAVRDVLARRRVAAQTAALLEQQTSEVAAGTDTVAVEGRVATALEEVKAREAEALSLLSHAQSLITEETPVEQVNQARFYYATLHFYRGDYYSAAVVADFLASRYPSTGEGRQATSVALASLVRLYGDGTSPRAAALRDQISRTAQRIAQIWKGQSEADDALSTLVTLAIQSGRLDEARRYLDEISPTSPRRSVAEMAVGQALWNQVQQEVVEGNSPAAAEQRLQAAVALMTQGLQREPNAQPSPSLLSAALLTIEHNLRHGSPLKAIELLEHQVWGPKTLADQSHPLIARDGGTLAVHIDQLALLAYVSALPLSDEADVLLQKAMETLEQIRASSESGKTNVAATYVSLARSLQQQIESASEEQRGALVEAFAKFLAQAAETAQELSVMNWVADSYLNLGRSLPDRESATPFLTQATHTYKTILQRVESGDFTVTRQEHALIQTRLAMALREQGDYQAALRGFMEILREANNQVYVQMEAAKTLRDWGDSGHADGYFKAMVGDFPDTETGRNLIWGFGRIGQLTAGQRQLSDLFYEARLELARCRQQYALTREGTERKEGLEQAERDLLMTARLYPELGGPARRADYEHLLHSIQRSLGRPTTGLNP